MAVRTTHFTLTQTESNKAVVRFNSEQANDNNKPDITPKKAAAVNNTRALVMAKDVIEVLFGISSVYAPPEPRYPVRQSTTGPAQIVGPRNEAVLKLTGTQRQEESKLILQAVLFVFVVDWDGIFVGGVTENLAPPPERAARAPRLAIEAPPPETAAREPHDSWLDTLPSRAGSEASGLPRFTRPTATCAAVETPPEREPMESIEPIERIEIEATERAAEEAPVTTESPIADAEPRETMPDPDSDTYAAYRQEAHRQAPAAETVPIAAPHAPQLLTDSYAKALQLRAAVDNSTYHEQENRRDARRSADEAARLHIEAARQQDRVMADALRDDAQRFHVHAEYLNAEAARHRLDVERYDKEIAALEQQQSEGLTAAPAA